MLKVYVTNIIMKRQNEIYMKWWPEGKVLGSCDFLNISLLLLLIFSIRPTWVNMNR